MSHLPDFAGFPNKLTSTVTLDADNTTAQENIVTVTGCCEMIMCGEVADATTMANLTAVHLETWDGTASVDISEATGATLSGLAVGTMVFRDALVAVALSLADNAAGAFTDAKATGGSSTSLVPFKVTKKTAATTYVRMHYATTDAPINAQITWHVAWRPLSSDGAVVAV